MRAPAFSAVLLLAAGCAGAAAPPLPASGTVQYAFAPGDHADTLIVGAIDDAQRQVLVLAYSFTHRRIADALVRAHRRGVEVAVVMDASEARAMPSVAHDLARAGVAVRFDDRHAAAHNKTMVIDGSLAACAVVTGSFNFTYAAQQRNAENALLLRGNPPLCEAYAGNWRRHFAHAAMRP